jgi:hypothetical protein
VNTLVELLRTLGCLLLVPAAAAGRPPDLDAEGLPTARAGTWRRVNALLLAALRVWELKHGYRLFALPAG